MLAQVAQVAARVGEVGLGGDRRRRCDPCRRGMVGSCIGAHADSCCGVGSRASLVTDGRPCGAKGSRTGYLFSSSSHGAAGEQKQRGADGQESVRRRRHGERHLEKLKMTAFGLGGD